MSAAWAAQAIAPYILWIGSAFTEETALTHRAVSVAANRWQTGLLDAVINQGVPVEVLGHLPEPLWPRGRLWIHGDGRLAAYGCRLVDYLNAPLLRTTSLTRSLRKAVDGLVSRRGRPVVMLTYNVSPSTEALARFARAEYGIPWIPVIADADGSWPTLSASLQSKVAGYIFLSWHCFITSSPGAPRLHLDGGVRFLRPFQSECETKSFLYSGALNKFGGIEFLLSAFRLVRSKSAELWICGKGDMATVRDAQSGDPRIRVYGAVTDAVLEELSSRAWAFVNPRPTRLAESQFNFPSKVLEYLSYGKPVASTWTLGLAPEYRRVLDLPADESPQAFADVMEGLCSESGEARASRERVISEFLLNSRIWSLQARRLIDWLRASVEDCSD